MVRLFHPGGVDQAAVLVQDSLREAGGPGGKIDRRVVVLGQLAGRETGVGFVDQFQQVLRKGRAAGAFVHQRHIGHIVRDFLNPADEFRPENQHVAFGKLQAVFNFTRGIAEVHRHHHGAGFQNAEIDRQPVEAVHHQNRYLAALADIVAAQHIGNPVGFLVKNRPGHFPAVVRLFHAGLHQFEFVPGNPAGFRLIRVDFHQGHVVRPFPGISFQQVNNGHLFHTFLSGDFQ